MSALNALGSLLNNFLMLIGSDGVEFHQLWRAWPGFVLGSLKLHSWFSWYFFVRLLNDFVHLSQKFHLLCSRLSRLGSIVFKAFFSLDRLTSTLWRLTSISSSKWPAPPMKLLFQVLSWWFISLFFLFYQKSIQIFLWILLYLRWGRLFSIFDQVLMIKDSFSAIWIVLTFIKLQTHIVLQHGAILHVMIFCQLNGPPYLFKTLLGSESQLPFFYTHLIYFHVIFFLSFISRHSLLLGQFICSIKFFLIFFDDLLLSWSFFLYDVIIVLT